MKAYSQGICKDFFDDFFDTTKIQKNIESNAKTKILYRRKTVNDGLIVTSGETWEWLHAINASAIGNIPKKYFFSPPFTKGKLSASIVFLILTLNSCSPYRNRVCIPTMVAAPPKPKTTGPESTSPIPNSPLEYSRIPVNPNFVSINFSLKSINWSFANA